MFKLVLILMTFLCLSFQASAGPCTSSKDATSKWKIEKKPGQRGSEYYLLKDKIRQKIEVNLVAPEIREIKTCGKLEIVLYLADSTGTFAMQNEIHGAIFEKETGSFKGSYPHNYELLSDLPEKYDFTQPVWNNENGILKITEKELGLNVEIKSN